MSFDVLPHNEPLPSTLTASRDVVSELGAAINSTGPSNAHIAQKAPPTSAPDPPAPSSKKRKAFKVTKPPSRSLSTPHVRGVIMSDAEADKKRNKLGYQRISIACAHCRRRKIRCLIAEGDPHGRCQNCIRLKKECAFYPVDQQGIIENKSQPSSSGVGSNPSTGSGPSSTTPPDFNQTRTLGDRRDQSAFPTLPSNVPEAFSGVVGIPITQGTPFASQTNDLNQESAFIRQAGPGFHQQTQSSSPWMGAGGFHDPTSGATLPASDFSSAQYWRQSTMHTSGDAASFDYNLMPAPSAPQRPNPYAFQTQRTEQIWSQHPPLQQPTRSMSYGQIEGYSQNMDPFSTMPTQIHASGMARAMPPSLEIQNASMMGPGPQSAPVRQDYQGFLHGQHPYAMPPGDFAPKPVLSSTDSGYPTSLYQGSPHLGSVHGSQHDSLHDSSNYAIHPSQPG